MAETVNTPTTSTERLAISTVGEVEEWLSMVNPTSPESTVFLDGMRSIIADTESSQYTDESAKKTRRAALTLSHSIGQRSERSFQAKVADGLDASREITDGIILAAAVEFDPNHPSFKGYQDSADILAVYEALEQVVRQEVPNAYQS